jgi:hypothetical protein
MGEKVYKLLGIEENIMSRGIVYVCFGEEYDRLGAHTIALSRKFISAPITVLTNLKTRCAKWKESPDINFVHINMHTNSNREVKVQLYKYAPYDETLYVDCDSIVTRPGIEGIFDHLKSTDFVFQNYDLWSDGKRYYRIYRDAARVLNVSLPLRICVGGFWAFRKTETTTRFFDLWHSCWKKLGSGRDMPALACAIKKSEIPHDLVFKKEHKFFSFGMPADTIVLHRMHADDLNRYYGVPVHKQNKEFDKGHRDNWDMVYFDDESNRIVNDPWIVRKFDREKRILDKEKYIDKYLPEMNAGGLSVLDIATGPGEFLELAQKRNCEAIGNEAPSKMLGRGEDNLYEKFGVIKHKEKDLYVIYADANDIIEKGNPDTDGKTFDIINCQHAINFIAVNCFNFKPEQGPYQNNGEWIFGDTFNAFFDRFFKWCKNHLNANGIVMIAALHADNKTEYSEKVSAIARENGFCVEINDKDLNHKFRGATRYVA